MRKGCSDAIIISAHLNLDKMLDLSDAEMVDKIDQIWLKVCQTKKNFQKEKRLGVKINTLFENNKFLSDNFSIIKGIGSYKNNSGFLKDSRIVLDKVIYVVRAVDDITVTNEKYEEG